MGNSQSQNLESEDLIPTFVLYCEQENKKKIVSVTDNGIQFPMRGETILIPYISIVDMKSYSSNLCGCDNLIYIGTSSGKYYYFTGKGVLAFERAIKRELPEIETLL